MLPRPRGYGRWPASQGIGRDWSLHGHHRHGCGELGHCVQTGFAVRRTRIDHRGGLIALKLAQLVPVARETMNCVTMSRFGLVCLGLRFGRLYEFGFPRFLTQRTAEDHRGSQRSNAAGSSRTFKILAFPHLLSMAIEERLTNIDRSHSSLWRFVFLSFFSVLNLCFRGRRHPNHFPRRRRI
jgi:hypothetical protein